MQTDVVMALTLENNDFIVRNGAIVGYVYMLEDIIVDNDQFIVADVVDEDAEHVTMTFGPFEPVTIAVAFEQSEWAGMMH